MFLLRLVLDAVVLPLLVSAIVLALLLFGMRGWPRRIPAAAAISMGVGYLTGHFAAIGLPPFPPVESTQWLFFVVALSMAAGIVSGRSGGWRVALAVSLIALLLGTTLKPMLVYHWQSGEALLWCAALFALISSIWLSLHFLERGAAASLVPLSFLWVLLATAVVMGLSASALLAQLSLTTAACVSVLAFCAIQSRVPAEGWLPVGLVILAGLILNGYFYAQLTGWNAVFLAAALPAAWFSRSPGVRHGSERRRLLLGLMAVMLVTVPALASAGLAFQEEPGYDYEEYASRREKC